LRRLTEEEIDRIAGALSGLPTAFDAPPHVYTVCCPRFEPARFAEREQPAGDQLRLYVHIPFCQYKCTFCTFAVRVGVKREGMERYVEALHREIDWIRPGYQLSQLFVGGGTPTALPPDLLHSVLAKVFDRVQAQNQRFHTVESSPETVTQAHVDVLRARGIGRVSMGIQSMEDPVLGGMHRRHTPEQAMEAARMLVASGLLVNTDLIYGLPGQTEQSFRKDFERIADLGVQALTIYNLRTNERTPIRRLLTEQERLNVARLVRWRMVVDETAADLGYVQTRWYTFKKADSIALEHRWQPTFDDTGRGFQIGVGCSARSHLGFAEFKNVRDSEQYVERMRSGQSPVEEVFSLDEEDRRAQFISRSLGDGAALDRDAYGAAFGRSFDDDYGSTLAVLRHAGLIEDDGRRIALSDSGRLIHDRVTLSLFPQRALDWLMAKQETGAERALSA
jgi:oxygen-independent coproporphyrinogen-3 oxidase